MYALSDDLQKTRRIKQLHSSPHEKPYYGTTCLKPFMIMKQNDSFEIVLDAKNPNSNTDQPSESVPLEFLATQLVRANKKTEICKRSCVSICTCYIRR